MRHILFSKVATITSPAPPTLLEACCSPMKRWSLCLLLLKLGGALWLRGSTQCGASDTVWRWRLGHTNTIKTLLSCSLETLSPGAQSSLQEKAQVHEGRHTLLLSFQPTPSINLVPKYSHHLEIPQHPIQPLQLMQHGAAMSHPCWALPKLQIYKQLKVVLSQKCRVVCYTANDN